MTKRFFKLLYVLALIAIALSLPIMLVTSVQWDRIIITSYKAKCISNQQYVVLQGGAVGVPDAYDEIFLNSNENRTAIKEQLNFYCKYYDEIQPHIVAYNEAESFAEQAAANARFAQFGKSVGRANVYAYPELFELEPVGDETRLYELYNPLVGWLTGVILAFLLLQVVRMCYVYVVFGKVVWHPFRKIESN